MSARTVREAVAAYLDRCRATVGCVTDRPLFAVPVPGSGEQYAISLRPSNHPAPIRLPSGDRLLLSVEVMAAVEPAEGGRRFAARGIAYRYHLLDENGGELLAFHWHPEGVSPVTTPHLHLGGRLGAAILPSGRELAIGGLHLPTGIVTLADVVRLLIDEFGVEPRRGDWQAILGGS